VQINELADRDQACKTERERKKKEREREKIDSAKGT
jgi:hypothetical protein